jgi:hypothetical protein
MKKLIFNRRMAIAILGIVFASYFNWNAHAQQLSLLAARQGVEGHFTVYSKNENRESKEELTIEQLEIEIEEIPTVTFINKKGEVVAVLYGDKNVLKDIYMDNLSKSYFLSAYGKHEIYLIN